MKISVAHSMMLRVSWLETLSHTVRLEGVEGRGHDEGNSAAPAVPMTRRSPATRPRRRPACGPSGPAPAAITAGESRAPAACGGRLGAVVGEPRAGFADHRLAQRIGQGGAPSIRRLDHVTGDRQPQPRPLRQNSRIVSPPKNAARPQPAGFPLGAVGQVMAPWKVIIAVETTPVSRRANGLSRPRTAGVGGYRRSSKLKGTPWKQVAEGDAEDQRRHAPPTNRPQSQVLRQRGRGSCCGSRSRPAEEQRP